MSIGRNRAPPMSFRLGKVPSFTLLWIVRAVTPNNLRDVLAGIGCLKLHPLAVKHGFEKRVARRFGVLTRLGVWNRLRLVCIGVAQWVLLQVARCIHAPRQRSIPKSRLVYGLSFALPHLSMEASGFHR
jgi:hypothetical protein